MRSTTAEATPAKADTVVITRIILNEGKDGEVGGHRGVESDALYTHRGRRSRSLAMTPFHPRVLAHIFRKARPLAVPTIGLPRAAKWNWTCLNTKSCSPTCVSSRRVECGSGTSSIGAQHFPLSATGPGPGTCTGAEGPLFNQYLACKVNVASEPAQLGSLPALQIDSCNSVTHWQGELPSE